MFLVVCLLLGDSRICSSFGDGPRTLAAGRDCGRRRPRGVRPVVILLLSPQRTSTENQRCPYLLDFPRSVSQLLLNSFFVSLRVCFCRGDHSHLAHSSRRRLLVRRRGPPARGCSGSTQTRRRIRNRWPCSKTYG